MKNSGRKKVIYGIFDSSGKLGYVGQTSDFDRRKRRHLNPQFREPRRIDKWLDSIDKKAEFKIIEECEWYSSGERERYWKSKLKPIIMD